jgi:hypothetical protein
MAGYAGMTLMSLVLRYEPPAHAVRVRIPVRVEMNRRPQSLRALFADKRVPCPGVLHGGFPALDDMEWCG